MQLPPAFKLGGTVTVRFTDKVIRGEVRGEKTEADEVADPPELPG